MASVQMQKPDEEVNLQANQVQNPTQDDTLVLHDGVNTDVGKMNVAIDKKKKEKKEKKEEKEKKDKDASKDKKEKKKNKDSDGVYDKKKQEKENNHDKEKKKHE